MLCLTCSRQSGEMWSGRTAPVKLGFVARRQRPTAARSSGSGRHVAQKGTSSVLAGAGAAGAADPPAALTRTQSTMRPWNAA